MPRQILLLVVLMFAVTNAGSGVHANPIPATQPSLPAARPAEISGLTTYGSIWRKFGNPSVSRSFPDGARRAWWLLYEADAMLIADISADKRTVTAIHFHPRLSRTKEWTARADRLAESSQTRSTPIPLEDIRTSLGGESAVFSAPDHYMIFIWVSGSSWFYVTTDDGGEKAISIEWIESWGKLPEEMKKIEAALSVYGPNLPATRPIMLPPVLLPGEVGRLPGQDRN